MPTNLHNHLLTFNHCSNDGHLTRVDVPTTTFGAPCAHFLGFEHGGLREVLAKLAASSQSVACADQQAVRNPKTVLANLQLRFHAKARESTVMSQALGAVVACASEAIARCIDARQDAPLRQASEIGLLVFSACLLSTSGDERAMLDDFAGAYENLHVTLLFVPPPLGKTAFRDTHQTTSSDAGAKRGVQVVRVAPGAAALEGSSGATMGRVNVTLCVSDQSAFDWVAGTVCGWRVGSAPVLLKIDLRPVLFNLGASPRP